MNEVKMNKLIICVRASPSLSVKDKRVCGINFNNSKAEGALNSIHFISLPLHNESSL